MDKVMFCANCGAKIEDEHADKCVYCGYIIERGAEEKFMRKLHDISSKLDVVDEQEAAEYRKDVWSISRKVLCIIGILVVVAVAIYICTLVAQNRFNASRMSADEKRAEMVWENTYYAMLDELYADGKYEEIVMSLESKEARDHTTYNWKHFEFASSYSDYMYIKSDLEKLMDEYEGESKAWKIESYVYDLFKLYYRTYATAYMVSEEEVAVLDECREEVLPILYNRMHFTDEEMDELLDEYNRRNEGYLGFRDTQKVVKKYIDRFE